MNKRRVVVVDYGMGNPKSVVNMVRKTGAESVLTSESAALAGAERLILTGVGSFDAGVRGLESRELVPMLNELVLKRRTPILGICLGMQLMAKSSQEGALPGLGWLPAQVKKLPCVAGLKIPHMGWDHVRASVQHPILSGLEAGARFYFAHSYFVECGQSELVAAECEYGIAFPVVLAHGNIVGVQFHPEKSHSFGERLLRNFVQLC
jgi:glutamine amidotransferase